MYLLIKFKYFDPKNIISGIINITGTINSARIIFPALNLKYFDSPFHCMTKIFTINTRDHKPSNDVIPIKIKIKVFKPPPISNTELKSCNGIRIITE